MACEDRLILPWSALSQMRDLISLDPRGAAWRDRSEMDHLAAVLRHIGEGHRRLVDPGTGRLHLVCAMARLAFAADIQLGVKR